LPLDETCITYADIKNDKEAMEFAFGIDLLVNNKIQTRENIDALFYVRLTRMYWLS